jgi:hypothetical protein
LKTHTGIIDYSDDMQGEELNKKMSLYSDVQQTFGTPHGFRVLLHLVSSLRESVMTGNSWTYYKAALQDYCRDLLDLVAASDQETYLKIHAQWAAETHDAATKEISGLREE